MKFRCERSFPTNFLTGILLFKEYEGNWPDTRSPIIKKLRDAEFKQSVANTANQISDKEQNSNSLNRLASRFDIRILLLVEGKIESFGEGMLLIKYYIVDFP